MIKRLCEERKDVCAVAGGTKGARPGSATMMLKAVILIGGPQKGKCWRGSGHLTTLCCSSLSPTSLRWSILSGLFTISYLLNCTHFCNGIFLFTYMQAGHWVYVQRLAQLTGSSHPNHGLNLISLCLFNSIKLTLIETLLLIFLKVAGFLVGHGVVGWGWVGPRRKSV